MIIKEIYTLSEAAAFLNVSDQYVEKLSADGLLTFKVSDDMMHIGHDELAAYKEEVHKKSDDALRLLVEQAQQHDLGY